MNYTFKLPTDHFQFYVQDRQSRPDTSMIWDEITELNRIAVEPGLIAVNTVRFGGLTLIELTIHHDHPVYVADNWEHIVHCSITLKSGKIILHSPELAYANAPIIDIEAGDYEVLVFFGNLNGYHDEMDTTGDDFYRLACWKGRLIEPLVIKPYTPPTGITATISARNGLTTDANGVASPLQTFDPWGEGLGVRANHAPLPCGYGDTFTQNCNRTCSPYVPITVIMTANLILRLKHEQAERHQTLRC